MISFSVSSTSRTLLAEPFVNGVENLSRSKHWVPREIFSRIAAVSLFAPTGCDAVAQMSLAATKLPVSSHQARQHLQMSFQCILALFLDIPRVVIHPHQATAYYLQRGIILKPQSTFKQYIQILGSTSIAALFWLIQSRKATPLPSWTLVQGVIALGCLTVGIWVLSRFCAKAPPAKTAAKIPCPTIEGAPDPENNPDSAVAEGVRANFNATNKIFKPSHGTRKRPTALKFKTDEQPKN